MKIQTKSWGTPRASGYGEAGASLSKRSLRSFKPSSNSPNMDINMNGMTLRQRARMLYMAAPIATSAINTARANVVGVGLTLKSSVDAELLGLSQETVKNWQRKTEAEFKLWAGKKQNCDALGMNSFRELQQLTLLRFMRMEDSC